MFAILEGVYIMAFKFLMIVLALFFGTWILGAFSIYLLIYLFIQGSVYPIISIIEAVLYIAAVLCLIKIILGKILPDELFK
jgi:hypothetical protein